MYPFPFVYHISSPFLPYPQNPSEPVFFSCRAYVCMSPSYIHRCLACIHDDEGRGGEGRGRGREVSLGVVGGV